MAVAHYIESKSKTGMRSVCFVHNMTLTREELTTYFLWIYNSCLYCSKSGIIAEKKHMDQLNEPDFKNLGLFNYLHAWDRGR